MGKTKSKIEENFLQLAKVALSGRAQDVQVLLNRIARKERDSYPGLSQSVTSLLKKNPTRSSPLRKVVEKAVPVDIDSRFQLLKVEEQPVFKHEPIYSVSVKEHLDRLIEERKKVSQLLEVGLEPTRTALFTGPPGVGKTLAARFIARELQRPLLILDLSSVMSSFLGRTGTNLKHVLEYAKSLDCVLLLDELDAIAKRRDDLSEIGELKRLVTVLIQELDDWPSTGLLLAATNHPELLDPAIWRRFEMLVKFPLPSPSAASSFIEEFIKDFSDKSSSWAGVLSVVFEGQSFNDIERILNSSRRAAALGENNLDNHLLKLVQMPDSKKTDRIKVAVKLVESGLATQRRAHELTGVARDTIRVHIRDNKGNKAS